MRNRFISGGNVLIINPRNCPGIVGLCGKIIKQIKLIVFKKQNISF